MGLLGRRHTPLPPRGGHGDFPLRYIDEKILLEARFLLLSYYHTTNEISHLKAYKNPRSHFLVF